MKKIIITVAATAIVVWGCTKKNNSTPRFCQMCTISNWSTVNGVKVENGAATQQVCGVDTIEYYIKANTYDSGQVSTLPDGTIVTRPSTRTTTCK